MFHEPVRFAARSGDQIELFHCSMGAGRRYKDGQSWSHTLKLDAAEGCLVLLRCAVRWMPLTAARAPSVQVRVGSQLAVPRPGFLRPSWT